MIFLSVIKIVILNDIFISQLINYLVNLHQGFQRANLANSKVKFVLFNDATGTH